MAYGGGGKYWNVGLSDPGKLSATKRQLSYLRSLTRVDHSGKGLTRDQASDLIDKAIEAREEKRADVTQVQDQMFAALMNAAARAANAAGEEWLRLNPTPLFRVQQRNGEFVEVHGRIGSAHITWPQKGQFHRWLEENFYDGQKKSITVPHHFAERMEADLVFACEKAAFEVLRKAGNAGSIRLILTVERGAEPIAA